jgi:hypothetical protein
VRVEAVVSVDQASYQPGHMVAKNLTSVVMGFRIRMLACDGDGIASLGTTCNRPGVRSGERIDGMEKQATIAGYSSEGGHSKHYCELMAWHIKCRLK